MLYQHLTLRRFQVTKRYYESHYHEYCAAVTDCLKSQLQWSDLQIIRDVIFVLATHGWQMIFNEEETSQSEVTSDMDVFEPLERLGKRFETSLVAAGLTSQVFIFTDI